MEKSKPIFITGAELLARDVQELPKLVDPLFPKSGVVAVAGESSLGKSSFLFQLGSTIVFGKDEFLGFKLSSEHKQCIVVSTEG